MNDVKILAFEEHNDNLGYSWKPRTMPAFSENIMKLYGLVKTTNVKHQTIYQIMSERLYNSNDFTDVP